MDRVFSGLRQPLHSGSQRKKWGFHWRLLVVFLFLGASESFPVSSKASNSINLHPFAWKHAPSPLPDQTEDSRIIVDSTEGKDSAKKTAKDTNSVSSSDMLSWLAKQFSPSTTPTKTRRSSEAPKKNDTAHDMTSSTEREIHGFPDVRLIQALVDSIKRSSSVSPSITISPVVRPSPSPSPPIPSVPAPAPEPFSPEPGTEVPAVWSEPPAVPECDVIPGSVTDEPYLISDCWRQAPYPAPETVIEDPYSIPYSEIEEPQAAPETEIEEPYVAPESLIEPPSIPEPEEPVFSPYTAQSESSEASASVQSEDSSELDDSPFSAVASEAQPSMEPTLPPKRVRPEDIKKAYKGVRIGVDGPKGKIGILVPVGVSVKLNNAIIEVPADVAVAVGVNGGNLAMNNVEFLFTQQPRVSRRALKTTKQSMKKQGLSLTNGSSANISNSKFEGSTDSMVSVEKESVFHCKDCVFHQNVAQGRGGAILAEDSSVILENCAFSNNKAQFGGAVWMSGAHHGDKAASLKIKDSVFMYNKVDDEGGNLWVKNADKVEVLDSRFSSGIGVNKGGALVVENTRELRIIGSHFDNNEAKMSSGGAASLAFCSTIEILNSTFESNSALIGGSATIYSDVRGGGQVNINNARFNDNKAQRQGGAILLHATAGNQNSTSTNVHVSIDQSSFMRNTAVDGGAIYVSSESDSNPNLDVEVKNTKFLHNSATCAGGGMYCGKQSSINFDSSFFQQNEAHTGKSCATTCGCSIHQKQTDSLELQDTAEDSSSHCDSSVTPSTTGETKSSSNAMTYVMVVLAVLVALIIILVGVLSKSKYRFQLNRRTEVLRSLSSFNDGASSPPQDLSVPLNESTEDFANEAIASEASAGRWMGSYTYREMDCPAPPRSTDLTQTRSVDSHFLSDPEDVEEAEGTQAILADDVFKPDTREPHLHPTEDAL